MTGNEMQHTQQAGRHRLDTNRTKHRLLILLLVGGNIWNSDITTTGFKERNTARRNQSKRERKEKQQRQEEKKISRIYS